MTIDNDLFLSQALDSVDDGISIIDENFKLLYHNQSITQRFGNMVGRECFKAYRGWKEPCGDCLIKDVMNDGKPRKVLRDTRDKEGNVYWMECSVGPVRNESGRIYGAVEIVRNVTENMRLKKENQVLRRAQDREDFFEDIITQSPLMKRVFRQVQQVAPTKGTVLIQGESGTGKELVARAIHQGSDRRNEPFVALNCGAISEQLLESELFGHKKGAFTGAVSDYPGLLSSAQGGTLFLDEIGEISEALQVKLLRFLQEGTIRPVGSDREISLDVRLIAATHQNMDEAVSQGHIREDFYYRINVIPLHIPPLRHRREDIPLLVNHFLQKFCDTHHKECSGVSSKGLKALMDYGWPGNIRELENVLEYLFLTNEPGSSIQKEDLPEKIKPTAPDNSYDGLPVMSIEDYTREMILHLQKEYGEEQIASFLGISRKNLWEKRKRWDLSK